MTDQQNKTEETIARNPGVIDRIPNSINSLNDQQHDAKEAGVATIEGPKAAKRLGTLSAVPRKRALRNDARKMDVTDAVGEIIDNAIDNYAKQENLGRVVERLLIEIEMSPEEIIVRENSGGVSPPDLQAFVQVGAEAHAADVPHIGVWGAGQKVALAALGSDDTISTRYWNPRDRFEVGDTLTGQVILRLDEDWWVDEENWDVPVYLPEADLPVGETVYVIRQLNRTINDDAITEVKRHIRDIYGDILQNEVTTITVNGQELEGRSLLAEEELQRTFAFPPGMEPAEHWFTVEARDLVREEGVARERLRKLRVRMVVGLTPHQEKAESGVYMFGVPQTESGEKLGARLFAKALQEPEVGYSEGPRSLLRRGDPTIGRLRIYLVFHGASEDIPWGLPGSPVKWGYYGSNPFAEQIRERIKQYAKPYVRYGQKAREIDLVPYSFEWNELGVDARKSQVRRGAFLASSEDVDEPDVKPRVKQMLARDFKNPEFRTWDHDKLPDAPPENAPAFDEALAKQAASIIQDRDRRLKELGSNDPVEAVATLVGSIEEMKEKEKEGWTPATEDGETPKAGAETVPVTVRIPRNILNRLREVTGKSNRSESILFALRAFLDIDEEN
jgi:hypothetical protein